MRILIVNDDGINAPGLTVAEEIAAEIAGPTAEIWVVAPENERSGASHAVSYTTPLRVQQIADRRYAIDGYPADCALVGLRHLLRDTPPDLVLSGVNRGFNLAEDVVVSGTVGAAMEAALAGARAIALSQAYSRGPDAPLDLWGSARAMGAEAVRAVLDMPQAPGVFYNVNFPARAPGQVSGMTVCPQGLRQAATFDLDFYEAANGRHYHFLRHTTQNRSAEPGSDAMLCAEGWVTITPLEARLTATHLLDDARAALAAPDTDAAAV
ncbi:MAG: 5'/3'-nucleotidase SurE [Pseudomonadota bacterium]